MANRQSVLLIVASLATSLGALYVAAAAYDGYILPFFGPAPNIFQVAFGAVLAICSVPFWVKGLRASKAA